jgi:branched-chain amino acid transport system ATP-binding protein
MRILEGEGITKNFGGVSANTDISFFIEAGEILGLIGPNGAGKTTLINCLSGNERPDRGTIAFQGRNIVGLKPYRICHLGISRTYQVVQPFTGMTVRENVLAGALFGGKRHDNMKTAAARVEAILGMVHLQDRAEQRAEDLTVVDLKRLELGKALAGEPKLLMLDEVMAGLNPKEIDDAMELTLKIRQQGITIFIVEHVMKAVMGISDRIIVLHQGSILATGKPNDISKDENVIRAYLGEKFAKKKTIKPVERK